MINASNEEAVLSFEEKKTITLVYLLSNLWQVLKIF